VKRPAITVAVVAILACQQVAIAQDQVSTHEQAVREFLDLMGVQRSMMAGATTMVDLQIQGNPALAPYREVILEWTRRYLTWDEIGPQLVKIYKESFTEPEVRELMAFYRTPVGQKALTLLPELMQKGAAIGAAVGQAHQADLVKMVEEKKQQLDAEAANP